MIIHFDMISQITKKLPLLVICFLLCLMPSLSFAETGEITIPVKYNAVEVYNALTYFEGRDFAIHVIGDKYRYSDVNYLDRSTGLYGRISPSDETELENFVVPFDYGFPLKIGQQMTYYSCELENSECTPFLMGYQSQYGVVPLPSVVVLFFDISEIPTSDWTRSISIDKAEMRTLVGKTVNVNADYFKDTRLFDIDSDLLFRFSEHHFIISDVKKAPITLTACFNQQTPFTKIIDGVEQLRSDIIKDMSTSKDSGNDITLEFYPRHQCDDLEQSYSNMVEVDKLPDFFTWDITSSLQKQHQSGASLFLLILSSMSTEEYGYPSSYIETNSFKDPAQFILFNLPDYKAATEIFSGSGEGSISTLIIEYTETPTIIGRLIEIITTPIDLLIFLSIVGPACYWVLKKFFKKSSR